MRTDLKTPDEIVPKETYCRVTEPRLHVGSLP